MLLSAHSGFGQVQKPALPDPIKFVYKYDIVWNVARAVLDEMGYSTELEDKKAGRIVSKPYEFITGALTSTEIDKVAIKRDTVTGAWLKARYTVEILLEIIAPNQTMVTVRTKMEGLNREKRDDKKALLFIGVFAALGCDRYYHVNGELVLNPTAAATSTTPAVLCTGRGGPPACRAGTAWGPGRYW